LWPFLIPAAQAVTAKSLVLHRNIINGCGVEKGKYGREKGGT
jgi:hypothetical protein